jgi:hypothetical protein
VPLAHVRIPGILWFVQSSMVTSKLDSFPLLGTLLSKGNFARIWGASQGTFDTLSFRVQTAHLSVRPPIHTRCSASWRIQSNHAKSVQVQNARCLLFRHLRFKHHACSEAPP